MVLPTYNEARNLPQVLRSVAAALEVYDGHYEILVVDDSSPDGSASIARAVGRDEGLPVRVLERRGARSLASAVAHGASEAAYGVVAVLDADMSHDPSQLPSLVEGVWLGAVDVVIGSRYVRGGRISRWPLGRRALSCLGTWLARALTRAKDPLSGFFACRRSLLDGTSLRLHLRGYKILLEILGRSRDLRIKEIPIEFKDRARGESKFRLRQKTEFLMQIVSLLAFRFRTAVSRNRYRARRAGLRPPGKIEEVPRKT